MPNLFNSLPFVTRDMLDFRHAMKTALVLQVQSNEASAIYVTGATKAGPFTYKHIPTADSALSEATFQIPDIPIWVSVLDLDGSFQSGQIHATLSLQIAGTIVTQLCAGYVHAQKGVSWPMINIENSLPTRGLYRKIYVEEPPVASQYSTAVPANCWWRVLGISFTLSTTAAVANRIIIIRGADANGFALFQGVSASSQGANTSYYYSACDFGMVDTTGGADMRSISIPGNVLLGPGFYAVAVIYNYQAGDAILDFLLAVEEFRGPASMTT